MDTLTAFVAAYEAYQGQDIDQFIEDWAQRLGVKA